MNGEQAPINRGRPATPAQPVLADADVVSCIVCAIVDNGSSSLVTNTPPGRCMSDSSSLVTNPVGSSAISARTMLFKWPNPRWQPNIFRLSNLRLQPHRVEREFDNRLMACYVPEIIERSQTRKVPSSASDNSFSSSAKHCRCETTR